MSPLDQLSRTPQYKTVGCNPTKDIITVWKPMQILYTTQTVSKQKTTLLSDLENYRHIRTQTINHRDILTTETLALLTCNKKGKHHTSNAKRELQDAPKSKPGIFLTAVTQITLYRVAQNKPIGSTFKPSLRKFA